MLETQLHFNFKDLFRAPRLALGRRMLVMLEALLVSYFVHLLLTYITLLVEGHSFGSIWNDIHLFPGFFICYGTTLTGRILMALAHVLAVIPICLGFTAVAKITIKEYKGNLFYSARDGWKWAFDNWFPVFFGPLSIAIIILFFVILAIILGWFAQWPLLDILIYGLLFIIFVPTALFLAVSVLALFVSLYMSPAIVACAEEDTMGTLFGSYTLLWNQPVRLIGYSLVVLLSALIGYHIFHFFMLSAFKFIDLVFGHKFIMGDSYLAIKQVGLDLFAAYQFLPSYFRIPECLDMGHIAAISPSITQTITGVLVGFVSLMAFLAVPAYALATLATGFASSFIVLTKHKDDQDLIKRLDADERAEKEEEEKEESIEGTEKNTAE